MADPQLPLKDCSQQVLRDLVDELAEEYRPILLQKIKDKKTGLRGAVQKIGRRLGTGQRYYDVDTGVVAVVEEFKIDANGRRIIDPASRKILTLNNGYRPGNPWPAKKVVPAGVTEIPRDLVRLGPFEITRDGQKIRYLVTKNDLQVEFEGTRVTRVVRPDGSEVRIGKFKNVRIPPNLHHAEMRGLDFVKRSRNSRMVATAPTRPCCDDCLRELQKYYGKDNIDNAVPKHRQTGGSWRSFLKELQAKPAPAAQPAPAARPVPARSLAPRSPATEFAVRKDAIDLARLRSQTKGVMAKAAIPNPKLVRIARFLKVAGPAMLAFDAATSYAKAADQWHKGEKDAAAETMAEFGGRAAGALVGAEACGLLFGGLGSVIPGLGTTVGGLAGAVIGGAVGAYLGEQEAKQLCHQIIEWTKGAHPKDASRDPAKHPATPPNTSAPAPARSSDPAVREFQDNMYQAGYGRAEADLIGKMLDHHSKKGPWGAASTPKDVFEHLGSLVVDVGPPDQAPESLLSYPAPEFEPAHHAVVQTPRPRPSTMPDLRLPGQRVHPTDGKGHHQDTPARPRVHAAPRPAEPRITESVVGSLLTPLPGRHQSRAVRSDGQDAEIADLSGRIDSLRQRIKDYDGLAAGEADFNSANQLEADLAELRRIKDQLMFLAASAIQHQIVSRDLDEVRNRYEQTAEEARRAQDQRDDLIRARADGERASQLEELQKQKQDQREAADERRRIETERRAEAQNLQELQQRQRDDAERDRVEDEKWKREKQERERAEDQRKREDEDRRKREDEDRRSLARHDRPQDGEPPRRDQPEARAEHGARGADTSGDAVKRRNDEDARRPDDAARSRSEEDARKRDEDAARKQNEEDARRLDDALRKRRQNENDARRQADDARRDADAIRARNEADARRQPDALQRRNDEEARRQADAIQRQNEVEARRNADAVQKRNAKDAGRQADAVQKQNEEEARRHADAVQRRNAEDARRQADAVQRQNEEEARRNADAVQRRNAEDAGRQADAVQKQNEEEARRNADAVQRRNAEDARRQADAVQKQNEEEARRRADAIHRPNDEEARKHVDAIVLKQDEETRRRADAIQKQNDEETGRRADAIQKQHDEEARRQADAIQKRNEEEAARRRADAVQKRNEEEARREAQDARKRERDKQLSGQGQRRDHRDRQTIENAQARNPPQNQKEQNQKERDQKQREIDATRRAHEQQRAQEAWERKRAQETRDRQHHDEQLKKRAEQERNDRERELRKREFEEERRRKEAAQRRQAEDRAARQREREAAERLRVEAQIRAQQDREKKEAEWARIQHLRQLERDEQKRVHAALRRGHQDEQDRKRWDRQRQQDDNERRRRDRQAEKDQRERQKQADREKRRWEKQQEHDARQRDRDARRNQPRYTTNVTGHIIKKWR